MSRRPKHSTLDDAVIVVDSDDREIGRSGKLDAHRSPGIRHRAFSLMVHDDGNWLLQQRASTKYHFAGLWSNTCCSHPRPGEDVLRAARRRLTEELGMSASRFEPVGRFEYVARDPVSGLVEHEMVHVVVAEAVTGPRPTPAEVDRVGWYRADELLVEIARTPTNFTPWLPGVLELAFEAGRTIRTGGAR
jgi:isopentenyl-diphosphate Delta-isomerase